MDREKVVAEIKDALSGNLVKAGHVYNLSLDGLKNKALKDALVLLKKKEVVEPKQVYLYGKEDWYGLVCVCPDCKAEWMSDESETHFCPNCGQAVIWNEID